MKSIKLLFASFGWLLILIPFISIAGTNTLITSDKDIQTRQVQNFHGIQSSGAFDVYIKIGNTENIRLEGNEDALKNVETKVVNGILKIGTKTSVSNWSWKNHTIKIYITAKTIKSIVVSGSGNMDIEGTLRTDNLDAVVSGSGKINGSIAAENLNVSISGSGKVHTEGWAKKSHVVISGSGKFEGRSLKTTTTDIKISGSGSAEIDADKTINAAISGSGKIYYSGNAEVNHTKSGSGSISKL